jgi:hypothetical protein
MSEEKIVSYKGFNADWTCLGFQFQVGATYTHKDKVKACSSGFPACEYPLDIFSHYSPATSVFAKVEQEGSLSRHPGDSKVASRTLKVSAQVSIAELVEASVAFISSRCVAPTGAATNTGDWSAATNTGNWSAATNTGNWSAATNTGDRSAATNTGYRSAATNTGEQSAATNTGYQSAAEVTGQHSVALSSGIEGKAKACKGGAIVLCLRDKDTGAILKIVSKIAGSRGVKADTWYTLDDGGKLVKA